MKALKDILSSFGDKYYIGNELNKAKVIQDIDSYDEELIMALLSNDLVKKHFAREIGEYTLIETNKLIETFEMDNYWMDSYTKYSKKIGLTSNGRFLDESTDMALDFPYKDTVLKAGMSKEDIEKEDLLPNEPFFNEVIAAEEIDTLLDKKVLVNAKRYTAEGVEDATEFSEEDNFILKGNNLLGLHTLKDEYAGKVKLIYIDVPYYFKKRIAEDSFKYNSNFHFSTWLTFLQNRLTIAKDLLSEEGSIWINISEDGMHYLKVLTDSIFNSNQFVGTLPRKTRDGKSDVPFNFSQDFDWILVYTKGRESDAIVGRKVDRKYYETEDFPGRPWRTADLTKQTTPKERPNSDFTMINPKSEKEYPVNPKRSWAVTKETFEEWYNKGGIGFPDDYDFMRGNRPFRRVFKDEDEAKDKPTAVYSDFLMREFITTLLTGAKNKGGNDEIEQLFTRDDFDYAKPESLIKAIIEVTTKENDLVLDFFMGSATTQAVAMKMNRRFIGIEQMDYINTVSVPRLQKVMEGEQGGISKDINWQGGGSFVYAELMEKSKGYLESVLEAENTDSLKQIYQLMLENVDLDFRADLEAIQEMLNDGISLDDKKRLLVKVIDKNQLYYNYSEIDDANVRDLISDTDYAFNQSFYKEEEIDGKEDQ